MPTLQQFEALGREIRRLRENAELSQDELAKKVGRTQPYISAIENASPSTKGGEPITPDDNVIDRLAHIFAKPPSFFHGLLGRVLEIECIPDDDRVVLAGLKNSPPEIRRAVEGLVAPYRRALSDEMPKRNIDAV